MIQQVDKRQEIIVFKNLNILRETEIKVANYHCRIKAPKVGNEGGAVVLCPVTGLEGQLKMVISFNQKLLSEPYYHGL